MSSVEDWRLLMDNRYHFRRATDPSGRVRPGVRRVGSEALLRHDPRSDTRSSV